MKKLRITVGTKSYDVSVEVLEDNGASVVSSPAPAASAAVAAPVQAPVKSAAAPAQVASSGGGDVVSPMAGSVKKVCVQAGDTVTAGQEVIVMEAMKMESSLYSGAAGTVQAVNVKEGDSVQEGQNLISIS